MRVATAHFVKEGVKSVKIEAIVRMPEKMAATLSPVQRRSITVTLFGSTTTGVPHMRQAISVL
jgi:hypothetical protein